MFVRVRMDAFGDGKIRDVEIPSDTVLWYLMTLPTKLETVFYYGQNDFQPQNIPSVSVGDVILLEDNEYKVESFGFSKRIQGGYAYGPGIHIEQGILWMDL